MEALEIDGDDDDRAGDGGSNARAVSTLNASDVMAAFSAGGVPFIAHFSFHFISFHFSLQPLGFCCCCCRRCRHGVGIADGLERLVAGILTVYSCSVRSTVLHVCNFTSHHSHINRETFLERYR